MGWVLPLHVDEELVVLQLLLRNPQDGSVEGRPLARRLWKKSASWCWIAFTTGSLDTRPRLQ
jgi:hypothetical protein